MQEAYTMAFTRYTERDRSPIVRHRQQLTYEGLRDEAAAAVEKSGESQAAVARALDVTRGAVSRAVKEAGPGWQVDLQIQIIEHLTPYRIKQEPVVFRALKKEI